MRWTAVAVLSLGGVLGVNARYLLGLWIHRWAGPRFPWGTLAVNASGSFAIGLLTVLLARWLPSPDVHLLLVTGVLGGYTTYSGFALEVLALWERGDRIASLAYLAATTLAGLFAVVLGATLARAISAEHPPAPAPPGAATSETRVIED